MTTTNSYDMQLGQALRGVRLKYMLKQADIAERLGVQKAAVARWENGSRAMSAATLLALADLFGIPAYELLPQTHQPTHASTATDSPADDAVTKITSFLHARPDLVAPVLDVILAEVSLPRDDQDANPAVIASDERAVSTTS